MSMLFNSCERLVFGTLISDIVMGVEHLRSEYINLTLSNTKQGTDLGVVVVPFEQTFYPLHTWSVNPPKYLEFNFKGMAP